MSSTTDGRWRALCRLCLRVALAALFLLSGVAKLVAIDDFELYVYSYGFLSLNAAYLTARLCIAAELLLGLFLVLGWWRRWVNLAALLVLLAFSLFLCYAALVGRTESCQCLGRLADLNPVQSLLKNAILIVLVLLYDALRLRGPEAEKGKKVRLVLTPLFAVAVLVAVFCISVPDNWMFGPEEARYDRQLLEDSMSEEPMAAARLAEGSHLVAFVTPGCPYCRMTREKLTSLARRNHLDTSYIHYYEPQDLPDNLFLRITYGQRPLVILLSDGQPVATYHYRNISERQLAVSLPKHR